MGVVDDYLAQGVGEPRDDVGRVHRIGVRPDENGVELGDAVHVLLVDELELVSLRLRRELEQLQRLGFVLQVEQYVSTKLPIFIAHHSFLSAFRPSPGVGDGMYLFFHEMPVDLFLQGRLEVGQAGFAVDDLDDQLADGHAELVVELPGDVLASGRRSRRRLARPRERRP